MFLSVQSVIDQYNFSIITSQYDGNLHKYIYDHGKTFILQNARGTGHKAHLNGINMRNINIIYYHQT